MIKISTLIDFIRGGVVATNIYRTIAPLEVVFPVITVTLNSSNVGKALGGDIKIESLMISINFFASTPTAVDSLTEIITERLSTLTGVTGDYSIAGFYLQGRKSIDYTDETTGKLVYGNSIDYNVTVKKS